MNKKEFMKIPIGTVLIFKQRTIELIEVKISENKTIAVGDISRCREILLDKDESGLIYDYNDHIIANHYYYRIPLRIAPKWIQEMFKIKGDKK